VIAKSKQMNTDQLQTKMDEVLDLVISDLATIRTGRVTPALVDEIAIVAYGGAQKLMIKELASIKTTDPQTLVIDPWDKSIIGDIKKGLLAANIGVNPAIDGEIIRISMPPMTAEDRQRQVKTLSQKLESGKVMVRQVRAQAIKQIKKTSDEKALTEDQRFDQEKQIQETTDQFIDKIITLGKNKEAEILNL